MAEPYHLDKLINFIQEELDIRGWTQAELAKNMDVRHTTIRNIMKRKLVGYPTIDILAKLATVTHVDLCAIVSLLFPETSVASAESVIFASRYTALPEESRKLMQTLIKGMGLDKDDKVP